MTHSLAWDVCVCVFECRKQLDPTTHAQPSDTTYIFRALTVTRLDPSPNRCYVSHFSLARCSVCSQFSLLPQPWQSFHLTGWQSAAHTTLAVPHTTLAVLGHTHHQ